MEPLLQITRLSASFVTPEGERQVLHDVDLAVARGETAALVGESGSGKSVTAMAILRLFEPGTVRLAGEVRFEGRDLLRLSEAEIRRVRGNRIAMIFQEPMSALNPVYTVGDQIMEPLLLHQGISRQEARRRAIDLLHRCGIPEPDRRIDSFPHQLSGGQRQRAMIAMALACDPALLIADEPTTALDVTIQAQILDLLADIQRQSGMAVLLISHDLNMVESVAHRVSIMQAGRIVEQGETTALFRRPRHPYTKKLLDSIPRPKAARRDPSPAPPLLTAQGLCCRFSGRGSLLRRRNRNTVTAVDHVTLTVREGATLAVVGESGSGKTTLGMCLLRLQACEGKILFAGTDIAALPRRRLRPLRRQIQVVFQDPFASLSPRRTVGQIVGEGLAVHRIGRNREERWRLIQDALRDVGLEPEMADRYPHEFSGGQRQRIAIARAIVLRPRLLVLDEPTSALDMTIQAQIIDLLAALQQRYRMSYLFISHDLRVVQALADEVAVMLQGRIVEHGPAEEVFARPRHPYTQALFAAAFALGRSRDDRPHLP